MQRSALSKFVIDELYANWASDRKSLLEPKWQKNLNAFKSVSDGFWKKGEAVDWRSDTFVPLTHTKVMAAYAMLVDQILQNGKIPFLLSPSPDQEEAFKRARRELMAQAQTQAQGQQGTPPGQPGMVPGQQAMALELPDEETVKRSIEAMQSRIEQQLGDCNADRAFMKIILSAAIYGEGWAHRFVDVKMTKRFQRLEFGGSAATERWELDSQQDVFPAIEYVSVWNIYRDLETDDPQKSRGLALRQAVSPWHLRQFEGKPYYDVDAIREVIREARLGTQTKDVNASPPGERDIQRTKNDIEFLEFWTRVPSAYVKEYMKGSDASNYGALLAPEESGEEVECLVATANERVIRFKALEEVSRPFYRAKWEEALDEVFARSVADNLAPWQLLINGLQRAYEDNKKLAGNVIIATKREHLGQWDGSLTPGMEIEVMDTIDDVRKAFQSIVVPDVSVTLLDAQAGAKVGADEACMLPTVMQGSVLDKQKPDTAYEMQQLQANAGRYLGSVIKNFDEGLVEPLVWDFYNWNMSDPDVTEGKGDFQVKAMGFAGFQDRLIRAQKLMQVLTLALSTPQLTSLFDIRGLAADVLKAQDLDASRLKSEEEASAMDKQAGQLQSAQMQAQMAMQDAQIKKLAAEVMKLQADAQKLMVDAQVTAQNAQVDAAVKGAGVQFDAERMKVDKAKAANEIVLAHDKNRREKAETVAGLLPAFSPGQGPQGEGNRAEVPASEQRGQGPYRERGMMSNNQEPGA